MVHKMRMFTFHEIRGKERARKSKYSKKPYTPDNTKRYEELIKNAYLEFYRKSKVLTGAVMMQVEINRKRPKHHYKERKGVLTRFLSKQGMLSKYPVKTPDVSNIIKSIEDALNGVAYKDDCQIVHSIGISNWNDDDRRDTIHVSILPLEAVDHGKG